ncbi:uncharacterized protein LOC141914677 [Tubulanus polymorphus]|uniref:uncharacterized protein LOC141914677 n=1 Tax=Tubulanus polymorphus TaxID=672921 RepID=UPI003DA2B54F
MKLFESTRFKGEGCPLEFNLPTRLYVGHRIEIQVIPSRLFKRFSLRFESDSPDAGGKIYSPLLFYYGTEYGGRIVVRSETMTSQREVVRDQELTVIPAEPIIYSIVIEAGKFVLYVSDGVIEAEYSDESLLENIKRIKIDGDVLVLYVDLMVDEEFLKRNGDTSNFKALRPKDRAKAQMTLCCGGCCIL